MSTLRLIKQLKVDGVAQNYSTGVIYDQTEKKTLDSILADLKLTLSGVKTAVDNFLTGEATDNGTMDRLVELVTAINNNKDSIDGLLSNKVAKDDIINNLTTNDSTKVLSAAQGYALKQLIDTLDQDSHTHANSTVLNGLSVNTETGNLVFNEKELVGTGIAVGATAEAANSYDSKLQIIYEEITLDEE